MSEGDEGLSFQEWVGRVPDALRADPLWKVQAYRMALYAADMGRADVTILAADRRIRSLSDQLYQSLGGVSACIAEGYSRGTGRDRALFCEYALGSAREARDWYYKGRHVLGEQQCANRIELLSRICKLLLSMIPEQRGTHIRETTEPYDPETLEQAAEPK
jgi:four helix bundle protein